MFDLENGIEDSSYGLLLFAFFIHFSPNLITVVHARISCIQELFDDQVVYIYSNVRVASCRVKTSAVVSETIKYMTKLFLKMFQVFPFRDYLVLS